MINFFTRFFLLSYFVAFYQNSHIVISVQERFIIHVSGIMVRVFANGLRDWGSIPGLVIPKTQKMVIDAALLNTRHYKVQINGKVEQSRK